MIHYIEFSRHIIWEFYDRELRFHDNQFIINDIGLKIYDTKVDFHDTLN